MGDVSTGGTNRQRERADLLRRLQVLKPRDGDVIVLKLPDKYFGEQGPNSTAIEFAEAVMKAAKRPVFIVQQGQEELIYGPPQAVGFTPTPPKPEVAVPKATIHLPRGVRTDGI